MAKPAKKKAKKKTPAPKPPKTPPVEAARIQAMLTESAKSADSRRKNILANTANARIRGHALGAHRAAQARRDAQQRGTKRPG